MEENALRKMSVFVIYKGGHLNDGAYLKYNWILFKGEWCVRSIELYDATRHNLLKSKRYEIPISEEEVNKITLKSFFNVEEEITHYKGG